VIPWEYVDEPLIAKKTNGLPDGEDGINSSSLVLTQYRRATDRRTDRITVAY